jgi:uncharacterized membrane protein YphA (DoxX/SURF4 family)
MVVEVTVELTPGFVLLNIISIFNIHTDKSLTYFNTNKTNLMKRKILFVLCLLFGLMFINAGLNKFLNYMPAPKDLPEGMLKDMKAFMEISWLMPLVGIAEIVGGVLFIIPRYRALGALIVFPIMLGILLTNITVAPSGLPIAITLLAVNLWVIFESWSKYTPMIKDDRILS